jgi:hypothetical protein
MLEGGTRPDPFFTEQDVRDEAEAAARCDGVAAQLRKTGTRFAEAAEFRDMAERHRKRAKRILCSCPSRDAAEDPRGDRRAGGADDRRGAASERRAAGADDTGPGRARRLPRGVRCDAYRDVSHRLFMQHNHLMQDQDLPAAVQVFAEDGQIRAMRIYLDGYFIVPLKRVMTHPAYVFDTVRRLVYVDGKAPRSQRVRFWLASQLLRAAGRLLSKTAGP